MTPEQITSTRLSAQHLAIPTSVTVQKLVSWMGAMQAQSHTMMPWAVGVRVAGCTFADVERAINRGQIIRTHVLRPTWHLIDVRDAAWMLDLSAPQIKRSVEARWRELELDARTVDRALKVIAKALQKSNFLDRNRLAELLEKNGIATGSQRMPHILVFAEIEKRICSGPLVNGRHTYALFEERVPARKNPSREEALERLALRYFTSHGPATLQDFLNWSGLPVSDGRHGLESVKGELQSDPSGKLWFRDSNANIGRRVLMLPAFDEYIIGYKDRSAVLPAQHRNVVISKNGMFWPIIVVDGQVVGQWKRESGKRDLELTFFPGLKRRVLRDWDDELAHAKKEVLTFFNGVAARDSLIP